MVAIAYLASPDHTTSLLMVQRFSAGGDFVTHPLGTFGLSQMEGFVCATGI